MNQLIQKTILSLSQIYRNTKISKPTFSRFWYATNQENNGTTEVQLKGILEKHFPQAKAITVEDVSGGCGAMYNIYVETKDFKELSIAKQHQAVYAALKEQIKLMHGLHVVTKAPP